MAKKKVDPTKLYVGGHNITYRNPSSKNAGKLFLAGHPEPLDFSHLKPGTLQRMLDSKILLTEPLIKPKEK